MRFILRRLGFFAVTLWAALTINFFLPRLMPGNPAIAMMARFRGRLTGNTLKAMEVAFGVDTRQGLVTQYFDYLGNSFTGHFGTSLAFFPEAVSHVVFTALPWTVGLVGVTTVLAFVIGTLIGIVSAWHRGGLLDSILPPVFVITSAFPYFWIGTVAILFFSLTLHWLPQGSGYTTSDTIQWTWSFVADVLEHAVLPALTILVTSIGGWILTMRNNMITTLAEDYIRMARAKGLSPRRIMFDYAARNAVLPNLTGFGMSLGFVISGAILVEYIFAYPGVGYMLLQAVENEDYPLMQALFLLITAAVLIAILAVDVVTAVMDPRTRSVGRSSSAPAIAGGAMPVGAPLRSRRTGAVGTLARAIRSNRKALAGSLILVVFIFMAIAPGIIAPDSPSADAYSVSAGPSGAHLLGTTAYGQDIFSQLIWGTRASLLIAVIAGLFATVLSVVIGVSAAYLGGLADDMLSLFTDVFLVIPTFPLVIVIAAYAKNGGNFVLVIVLVVTGWSYGARQLRSQALSLRNRDFLVAARVRGERRWRIIVFEVLPTMTSLIVANFLGAALYAVLTAAGLQFIGLGNVNTESWGTMLYWAQNNEALQSGSPLWATMPGVCIALLGAAFALLNYAFDEISNPGLRQGRLRTRRPARA